MNNINEAVEAVLKIADSTDPTLIGTAAGLYYFKDVVTGATARLVYPSAEAVGTLFGKILEYGTFQSPHSRDAAGKVARAVFDVSEKLKDTTPEDLVGHVPPELAVPIFTKLSYFDDNDLRELLTSLLASSMLRTKQVHPTVVSTVDRMTPGEARIIKHCVKIRQFGPWPSITVKGAIDERTDGFIFPSKEDLAHLQAQDIDATYTGIFDRKGPTRFIDLGINNIASMDAMSHFTDDKELAFYVSNLRNIGIIETTEGILANKKKYIDLVAINYRLTEDSMSKTGKQPILEASKLSLTSLGREIFDSFGTVD